MVLADVPNVARSICFLVVCFILPNMASVYELQVEITPIIYKSVQHMGDTWLLNQHFYYILVEAFNIAFILLRNDSSKMTRLTCYDCGFLSP